MRARHRWCCPVAPVALAAPTALRQLRLGTTTVSAPAPVGPETTISGPQTAKVGQEFKITGKTDPGIFGSKVYAYQDGKKIAAERTVAATMATSRRGHQEKVGANQAYQFRVVDGAKNVGATPFTNVVVSVTLRPLGRVFLRNGRVCPCGYDVLDSNAFDLAGSRQ